MELHRAAIVAPRADVVYGEAGNSALQIGAAFPREHTRSFSNVTKNGGILLSRSAWAGSNGLGAAVWSGDTKSDFAWLKLQIPAVCLLEGSSEHVLSLTGCLDCTQGLNMAMSGQLWWTTDAGGFTGGNSDSPAFRELLVRWLQFATVCPIMRWETLDLTSQSSLFAFDYEH